MENNKSNMQSKSKNLFLNEDDLDTYITYPQDQQVTVNQRSNEIDDGEASNNIIE